MVYIRRTPGSKFDQVMRWNLPDRVFFAAGACHILSFAFLELFPRSGGRALWIRPMDGSPTNHIFVDLGEVAFDYHGYSKKSRLLDHFGRRARKHWPAWQAELVELPGEVLVSGPKSRTYAGLWLREPDQFLHNPLPRAQRYIGRFAYPQCLMGSHFTT